jgi:hypothetical protein
MAAALRCDRRRLLGPAVLTMAAARRGLIGAAGAPPRATPPAAVPTRTPGAHTSCGALQPLEAGVLQGGYAEAGPADGPAVLLRHGWPYDRASAVDVAPVLAAAGDRGLVPSLRGYGPTRCRSPATPRHGQPSGLAVELLALREARPGPGRRARRSERPPGAPPAAPAAQGHARLGGPMVCRHCARPGGRRALPARLRGVWSTNWSWSGAKSSVGTHVAPQLSTPERACRAQQRVGVTGQGSTQRRAKARVGAIPHRRQERRKGARVLWSARASYGSRWVGWRWRTRAAKSCASATASASAGVCVVSCASCW